MTLFETSLSSRSRLYGCRSRDRRSPRGAVKEHTQIISIPLTETYETWSACARTAVAIEKNVVTLTVSYVVLLRWMEGDKEEKSEQAENVKVRTGKGKEEGKRKTERGKTRFLSYKYIYYSS